MAEKLTVQKLAVIEGVLVIEYPQIKKTLRIPLEDLKAHAQHALEHGWKQRFGDLEAGDKVGKDKFVEAKRLWEHLKNGGDWRMSGERDTTAIVMEALNRLNPKKYPMDLLKKAVEAKPEQVKVWRADGHVKAEIAKIYLERAQKAAQAEKVDEIKIEV